MRTVPGASVESFGLPRPTDEQGSSRVTSARCIVVLVLVVVVAHCRDKPFVSGGESFPRSKDSRTDALRK